MFRKFTLSPVQTELFDEHSFFKAFSRDMKQARRSVIIESPYITVRRARDFAKLVRRCNKKLKITVITRNPHHHDGNLVTQSIIGLAILKDSGINVIVCDDFRHRKLAIVDDQLLWEGSLNMLSHSNSKEIMRRTQSEELCRQMMKFTSLKKDLK